MLSKQNQLRKLATVAEKRIWSVVRDRRFQNLKFRRQYPIGQYIVDFICLEIGLIIEVDGSQHMNQASYDQKRTCFLETQGFKVIRFWNNDVLNQLDAVLKALYEQMKVCIESPSSALRAPSPASGRRNHLTS